ncbi:MAG TPA: hypothetical protein VHS96_14630 [Bacteroidia bacterium]|nr:hypothetical protein [Bacteroidia bacterium]
MKSTISFLFLTFMILFAPAQGFVGFEYPENQSQTSATVSSADRLRLIDTYLETVFPGEFFKDTALSAFIYVPANGCHYCASHVIRFFKDFLPINGHLKLILSGPQDHSKEQNLKSGSFIVDKDEISKKYGFNQAFPTIGLLDHEKTTQLIRVESQHVDKQLEQITLYLSK